MGEDGLGEPAALLGIGVHAHDNGHGSLIPCREKLHALGATDLPCLCGPNKLLAERIREGVSDLVRHLDLTHDALSILRGSTWPAQATLRVEDYRDGANSCGKVPPTGLGRASRRGRG